MMTLTGALKGASVVAASLASDDAGRMTGEWLAVGGGLGT
jgi:hypothetical protein